MQFIDQAQAYTAKSLSLEEAIRSGRAKLTSAPGSEKMLACFRPDLDVATAFDRNIDPRFRFNDLSTSAKLDLMIDELLPGFFHADLLPTTGRQVWNARFVIDGNVTRDLQIDPYGLHVLDSIDEEPSFELETDVMTLMAILRSIIADFHTKKLDLAAFGTDVVTPVAE